MESNWKETIVKELVTFSGQTFSNSYDAMKWLNEAFYRVAEQAEKNGYNYGKGQADQRWAEGVAEGERDERARILEFIEDRSAASSMDK